MNPGFIFVHAAPVGCMVFWKDFFVFKRDKPIWIFFASKRIPVVLKSKEKDLEHNKKWEARL